MKVKNSSLPKVIELNGLAGVGKTTLANLVIERLRTENYRVAQLNDVYFWNESKNTTSKCVLLKALLKPNRLTRNYFALEYFLTFKISIQRIKYYLKLIKLDFQLEELYDSGEFDYIVLEEGIIQYLSAIAHCDIIKDKNTIVKYFTVLFSNIEEFTIINCDLDLENVIKRIRARNSPERRIDALPDDVLLESLSSIRENIRVLRSIANCKTQINICLNGKLDFLVDTILNEGRIHN